VTGTWHTLAVPG